MSNCTEIVLTAEEIAEIREDYHESTLNNVFQFDLMTKLGYTLNFLTGEYQ